MGYGMNTQVIALVGGGFSNDSEVAMDGYLLKLNWMRLVRDATEG
jgi:hypothetical protein